MGIRDSRHTITVPRWAVSTGEVLDPNAVAPPGPQQDTGWVPGVDVPVGNWWNWLHQQTGLFLEYFESIAAKRWTNDHLPRTQKGTTALSVSAGVGLSVNVVAGYAWLQGAQYQFAAATNLALVAADPTNPRYDLVVVQQVGGVPSIAVVTGTPAAAPAEPSIASNQLTIARLRVAAAAVAPSLFVDRRIFGALSLARFAVDTRLAAGDIGGGSYLLDVDTELTPVIRIGETGTTILGTSQITIFDAANQIHVSPEAVQFTAPIRRKYDIGVTAFTDRRNVERNDASGLSLLDNGAVPHAYAAVRIPNGGTITTVRLYGNRVTNTPGFSAILYAVAKGTGVQTVLGTMASNAGTGATGDFTRTLGGISHVVDQSNTYELFVLWIGSAADLRLRGAEVEWEESKPFDGI